MAAARRPVGRERSRSRFRVVLAKDSARRRVDDNLALGCGRCASECLGRVATHGRETQGDDDEDRRDERSRN